MKRKLTLHLSIFVLALGLTAGFGSVHAQQTAPTESKGITAKQLQAVDLGPEIAGMGGRQLRMRMVTIDSGGVFAVHSHKDRPGTVYVLQGKITEHRGDVVTVYSAGGTWSEDKETTHWLENKETTPAVLIAVDVFKQP